MWSREPTTSRRFEGRTSTSGREFHVKQGTPPALSFLDDALSQAREDALLRTRPPAGDMGRLCLCSNDYLGLAERCAPSHAAGAGSSRLVAGERAVHRDLEAAAAALVGEPAALAFTSGYAANVGLLSSLAGPQDVIVSDALNHASLIDGARLSRALVRVVPHLDVEATARALADRPPGRAFVVTESYFSMDADSPDLPALRRVCDAHGAALIVDEAHALGVLGPGGRGLCAQSHVRADALVGTFGKAFGAGGAFVAGCESLVAWLWNRARSFVFSTGLSPVLAAAALEGLRVSASEPARREAVLARAGRLRAGLGGLGLRLLGYGPIVPWVVGDARAAVRFADALAGRGIDVRAIRPPSVPAATARLRFTVTAALTEAEVDGAVAAVGAALEESAGWPGA
jgi:8-amino-7-oxononanoate synthase